jgi:hypothetical protein
MVSKLLADFVIRNVLKALAKKIKPLEKYVYEDNELDEAVEKLEYKTNELSVRVDKLIKENKDG